MKKANILPPLVLTLICVIICALLVFAHELTKDRIALAQQQKLNDTLIELFGEGEYNELDISLEGVTRVIEKDNGQLAFEVVTSGYTKNGLDLIIGVDENGITGIGAIAVTETKNVGTKVTEPDVLNSMIGFNGGECAFDNVTGATYSSNALKEAAKIAVEAYAQYMEAGGVAE